VAISTRAAEPKAREPVLGILSRAGAQIKNQKPEFSLKLRTGARAMAI